MTVRYNYNEIAGTSALKMSDSAFQQAREDFLKKAEKWEWRKVMQYDNLIDCQKQMRNTIAKECWE